MIMPQLYTRTIDHDNVSFYYIYNPLSLFNGSFIKELFCI